MEEQTVDNQVQQAPVNPATPKQNYWIIAGIILVLLLISGVIFVLSLPSRKPMSPPPKPLSSLPPTSPTPDPTANWKTYRNEKYGFELKYPSDWEVYDYLDEEGKQLQITKGGPNQRERSVSWDDGASIVLFVSETDGQDEEEKGELFSYNDWSGFRNIEIQEYLKIDKITVSSKLPSGRTFFIIWEQIDPSNNGLTAEKFFISILSTFKFTNQENQVVCTQDVKQCPDGSYVSRQPPTCEFARCPQNK